MDINTSYVSLSKLTEMLNSSSYEEFLKIKSNLAADDRKNVKTLLLKYEKKYEKYKNSVQKYEERLNFEKNLWNDGYKYIAGIDEVGRGPLAGPVYAAAVIINPKYPILEIRDSKKLSPLKRELLSTEIKNSALSFSIGTASVKEIDEINILNATKLAMERAIAGLNIKPDHLLIDALTLENIDLPQTAIIKGDDLSISIGAASIVAKTERDKYMDSISPLYPDYLFSKNKGYGTKEHIDAISRNGLCEIHRRSFTKNFI